MLQFQNGDASNTSLEIRIETFNDRNSLNGHACFVFAHPVLGIHTLNSVCSLQALLGWLFFGETLSLRWWLGTSLILTGLILIHYNSEPLTEDHPDIKKE